METFLSQKIFSLKKLEILVVEIPLKTMFKSGIGTRQIREAVIVKLTNKDNFVGYGEVSCRPDCYYSHEFTNAVVLVLKDFIFPILQEVNSYEDYLGKIKRIRGWNFTKSACEFALNDLIKRKTGKGILENWEKDKINKIPVGISLGIFSDKESFVKKVKSSVEEGYERLKFKISPEVDSENFKLLDNIAKDFYVSFDANGTFYPKHFQQLKLFADLGKMIEQPFPPTRLDFYLEAKKEIPHLKVCLDEEVTSLGDLVYAHKTHSIDELNLKPGRVGGLYESMQIIDYCKRHNIPCWLGGMFETGIGRSQNLQIAGFLPEAKAHDLSPSSRYFAEDIVQNPIKMFEKGFVNAKDYDLFEINKDNLEKLTREEIILEN